MREALFGRFQERIGGIRVRSREISRLEGMTDATLGFAITLLIVSQEVPTTYDGLIALLWGFPSFALTFLTVMFIWFWHNQFFRQYGLLNGQVMLVSAVLMFLVLFFVYPLKFLSTLLINYLLFNRVFGWDVPVGLSGIRSGDASELHTIYALGFAAIFFCFAVLQWIALRHKEMLELDDDEVIVTKAGLVSFLAVTAMGLISCLAVYTVEPRWGALAGGIVMSLIWPATSLSVWPYRADLKRIKAAAAKSNRQAATLASKQGLPAPAENSSAAAVSGE